MLFFEFSILVRGAVHWTHPGPLGPRKATKPHHTVLVFVGKLRTLQVSADRKWHSQNFYCPQGPLCRAVKNSHVCSSVRPCVRASVRPTVTLIGSAPDLVGRIWLFAMHRPSSRPKTGPKLVDLVIGHGSSDLVIRFGYYL